MKSNKAMKTAEQTFLFQGVAQEMRTSLLQDDRLEEKHFAAPETVTTQKQHGRALGIVITGAGKICRMCGEKPVLLRTIGAGDVFGAAALFDDEGYVTTIFAKGRVTVLFVPQSVLEDWFAACPVISLNYIRFLSRKIRFLNDRIAVFTQSCGKARLAGYLLSTAAENDTVHISRSALAQTLDMGRASLYRALEELQREGAITLGEKAVSITSRHALKKYLS